MNLGLGTATARACMIHGAKDLRMQAVSIPAVGPRDVRVRVRAGGICGSDLHYFFDGRNGDFEIREPLVPGHEFSGEIDAVGSSVTGLSAGTRVAVHPGRACGRCSACRRGQENLCRNVFFMGSASKFPHMQGGFQDYVVVEDRQIRPVPSDLAFTSAAFAEPLSVALHALERAGPLFGRKMLITGLGPIGMLTLLAARRGGIGQVIATDMVDEPLAKARKLGADEALKPDDPRLVEITRGDDAPDIAIEASGSPYGLTDCLKLVRPGGVVVQLGTLPAGPVSAPLNLVMGKEIDLRGAFRFGTEFDHAVKLLVAREIDVESVLTEVLPADQAAHAFDRARDRRANLKVQIEF